MRHLRFRRQRVGLVAAVRAEAEHRVLVMAVNRNALVLTDIVPERAACVGDDELASDARLIRKVLCPTTIRREAIRPNERSRMKCSHAARPAGRVRLVTHLEVHCVPWVLPVVTPEDELETVNVVELQQLSALVKFALRESCVEHTEFVLRPVEVAAVPPRWFDVATQLQGVQPPSSVPPRPLSSDSTNAWKSAQNALSDRVRYTLLQGDDNSCARHRVSDQLIGRATGPTVFSNHLSISLQPFTFGHFVTVTVRASPRPRHRRTSARRSPDA